MGMQIVCEKLAKEGEARQERSDHPLHTSIGGHVHAKRKRIVGPRRLHMVKSKEEKGTLRLMIKGCNA